jgi:hypothetical protein
VRSSSLHYFEGDDSLAAGRVTFPYGPAAASDPAGRCAAVVMYRHQLAVLPAMLPGDEGGGGFGGDAEAGSVELEAAAVGNSYVDNLGKIGIKEVSDAQGRDGAGGWVVVLGGGPEGAGCGAPGTASQQVGRQAGQRRAA